MTKRKNDHDVSNLSPEPDEEVDRMESEGGKPERKSSAPLYKVTIATANAIIGGEKRPVGHECEMTASEILAHRRQGVALDSAEFDKVHNRAVSSK